MASDGKHGLRVSRCFTRHWSVDLIDLHAALRSRSRERDLATKPLRLILHLGPSSKSARGPSVANLIGSNSIDNCRTMFVHQLKEADFVRWGHTRRITGLRRLELEAAWNSIVEGVFLEAARREDLLRADRYFQPITIFKLASRPKYCPFPSLRPHCRPLRRRILQQAPILHLDHHQPSLLQVFQALNDPRACTRPKQSPSSFTCQIVLQSCRKWFRP